VVLRTLTMNLRVMMTPYTVPETQEFMLLQDRIVSVPETLKQSSSSTAFAGILNIPNVQFNRNRFVIGIIGQIWHNLPTLIRLQQKLSQSINVFYLSRSKLFHQLFSCSSAAISHSLSQLFHQLFSCSSAAISQ
jgi:hypothetical protein